MANSFFRFKQFTVHQEKSAMKVCTDSCVLGAWTAKRLGGADRILDIGAGTGLLSLMLAQQSAAFIDAIESDPVSFEEAGRNISLSPWSGRIRLYNADARHFHFPSQYDHVISNPPFYETDLKSPDKRINNARHGNSLTLEDLIGIVGNTLAGRGRFSVLLPYQRFRYFEKLSEDQGFFLQEVLTLQQTASHQPFRVIGTFGKEKKADVIRDDLTLADAAGKNSAALLELMKPYYL